jgi:hypothetical protein
MIKWAGSNKQSYINVVPMRGVTGQYTADDSGSFVPIVAFECRGKASSLGAMRRKYATYIGAEPVAWHPKVDFVVESTGGTLFENVDLSERDWADYDEENDVPVSVTELEYTISVHK